MVTITAYFLRESKLTKPFIALELSGDPEFIQSSITGRFYLTSKKCTISSTYTEDFAKMLIGKQLPGRIDRIEVEAYEYTNQTTGEVVTLNHSYIYVPEETTHPVQQEKPVQTA
ncbi:MAG TPA: hypothetical protein VGN00_20315 [Puia sp.]|jgi:hypothetical protein